jgi:hypothetical protein
MAAGLGFKDFVTGEVLTAADVDGYLMQGVWVFADAAARTAAVTSPQEGNISFLKDTNSTEYYSGSAWVAIGGSVPTSLEFTAGKNKIINGDFYVNQRNFSTTTSSLVYTYDRWQTFCSDGTVTYTAQNFTAGTAPVSGYEGKSFLRTQTTGQTLASAGANIVQFIEDVRSFAGQTATISFWAKAASGTPKIAVELRQNFGSGGSPSAAVGIYAGQVTLTTSWARHSITVAVPSISGKTVGTTENTSNLLSLFWMSAGTDLNSRTGSLGIQTNTFDIWGVQVEAGSTATSFQTATGTIQGELAACQRYYTRFSSGGSTFNQFGNGFCYSTTAAAIPVILPVQMRVNPSSIDYHSSVSINYYGITNFAITGLTLSPTETTANIAQVNTSGSSGLTQYRVAPLVCNNNTAGFLAFNAEF